MNGIINNIVLFIMIWWLLLFLILPIGVKRNPKPRPGWDSGAPIQAKIAKRFIYTTLLAIPVWGLLHLLLNSDWLLSWLVYW